MDDHQTTSSKSIFFDEEDDIDSFYESPLTGLNYSSMDNKVSGDERLGPQPDAGAGAGAVPLLINRIDRNMKDHTEHLIRRLQCLTPRFTQLQTKMLQAENDVNDFKLSVDFNHGRSDKRLSQLYGVAKEMNFVEPQIEFEHFCAVVIGLGDTNTLIFMPLKQWYRAVYLVHGSVKDIRDKQDIAGAQLQLELAKLTVTKTGKQTDKRNPPCQTSSSKNKSSSELQDYQQPLPTYVYQPPQNALPDQTYPRSSPTFATMAPQFLSQAPPLASTSQPEHFYQCPGSNSEFPQHHYRQSSNQEPHMFHPALHQPNNVPALQHSYTGSTQIPDYKPYSEFPPGYSQGSSSYDRSTAKNSQLHTSSNPSVRSGYKELPTAKVLPHAIPTAVIVDNKKDSGVSREKAPVDDVVGQIVAMGFRRDLVRSTLKKLMENKKSVDLNVVLDAVMNNRES
ncbi:hypothetical protein ACFE04_028638 [Oxalis oulophora]